MNLTEPAIWLGTFAIGCGLVAATIRIYFLEKRRYMRKFLKMVLDQEEVKDE